MANYKAKNNNFEMSACHTIEALQEAIFKRDEKIVYRANGNRTVNGSTFLRRLEKIYPKVGITRVAEISHLAFNGYSVYQATRPKLHTHWSVGQNTGSQGKGPTVTQAKISAIMEGIESYCAEPKNMNLIRNSYNQLKNQHRLIRPSDLIHCIGVEIAMDHEPIMWTEALHYDSQEKILVPAEAVFFPFSAADFQTRSLYSCSSNGLASGATYIEAVIHALYEIIERYYWAAREIQEKSLVIKAIYEDDYHRIGLIKSNLEADWAIQLYALFLPNHKNIPVVMCSIVSDLEELSSGWGCCLNVDIAIERAISEAFQGLATKYSGAREDMNRKKSIPVALFEAEFPLKRSLHLREYKKMSIDKAYKNLRDELNDLVSWLKNHGFKNLCIANLSRVGVDVPVVKVIVPGLDCAIVLRQPKLYKSEDIKKSNFSF